MISAKDKRSKCKLQHPIKEQRSNLLFEVLDQLDGIVQDAQLRLLLFHRHAGVIELKI